MVIGIHIGIALVDRRAIATDIAARCEYARVVTRIGENYGLIAHGLADDHGHLVVRCDRAHAGTFAQAVEKALRHRLAIAVPFGAAYFKLVREQSHLRRLIPYVHGQAAHHGVSVDPFCDASSLPDLVGARFIGGEYLGERLAACAPRIRPAQHIPAALKARRCPTPSIEQAAAAAAAAIGRTSLIGQTANIIAARRAAIEVAVPVGRARLAAALACSLATVSRLKHEPARPELVAAVRLQVDWRFGGSQSGV
jgi:hypothetical protein